MQFTSFESTILWVVIASGILGVLYALYLRKSVLAQDPGTEKMQEIGAQIREGAYAYLSRQFKTIAWLVIILVVLLSLSGIRGGAGTALGRGLAFLLGCLGSGLTGYIGMTLAVRANTRCTAAARTSISDALSIAFRAGGVTGMFTVTMGLLGATVLFMIYKQHATEVLLGFGFGGSLLALFMRVGGGIYTKAADVGADLVGKLEAGIPEDDPRNAAVIADNVGDNVGDCAGMAADIFESYEVTLVASMILALAHFQDDPRKATVWIVFPLIVRAIGVITSMVGIWIVKMRSDQEHPMACITRGVVWSAVLSAIGFFIVAQSYVTSSHDGMKLFWATVSGLVLAIAIYKLTEYYTSHSFRPVKTIAHSTQTGSATTILTGFAEGLEGSVWALIVICGSIFASVVIFAGGSTVDILYGVSLCGLGMLTTTGVIISMDTFGPVVDNAQGISEMAQVEEATDAVELLDAVGNTTKAATKGIAIASAVIAAIALFGSYLSKIAQVGGGGAASEAVSIKALAQLQGSLSVDDPRVFIGLLIGGAMPLLFSSMTIRAVSRAAFQIINEVRRQFREIPGLMEGTAMPESAKVVDICTASALRELVAPALLAILSPIIVGALFGWAALGGFLAGIIVVGQLLAVLLCDAGGAWDNAKKLIEDGAYGGKGSDAHTAAVVGDTVGDPFKDTAGPALNPLLKVMNMVALLVVPFIAMYQYTSGLYIIGVVLAVVVAIALIISKGESQELPDTQQALDDEGAA